VLLVLGALALSVGPAASAGTAPKVAVVRLSEHLRRSGLYRVTITVTTRTHRRDVVLLRIGRRSRRAVLPAGAGRTTIKARVGVAGHQLKVTAKAARGKPRVILHWRRIGPLPPTVVHPVAPTRPAHGGVTGASGASAATGAPAPPNGSGGQSATSAGLFVSVCGSGLCVGANSFTIKGATAYGQYANPAAEIAKAQAGNLDTLELVEFDTQYHQLSDTESAATWTQVDAFIAAAAAAHMHVILNLSEYGQSLQAAGITMASPAWQTDWNQYLAFVADRVNTRTSVAYKDDPTIAMVELWGEIPAPAYSDPVGTTAQLQAFFATSLAQWKALAPNILGSSGGFSYLNDAGSGIPWQAIMNDPNDATCDVEINSYPDRDTTIPAVTQFCKSIGKPWFLAAWSACDQQSSGSWDIDSWQSDAQMAAHASNMYAIAAGATPAAYPAIGSDFWNLGPGTAPTCDLGPQFPLTWSTIGAA
jgi:hypothetical protein